MKLISGYGKFMRACGVNICMNDVTFKDGNNEWRKCHKKRHFGTASKSSLFFK